jgi:hypothetical protein
VHVQSWVCSVRRLAAMLNAEMLLWSCYLRPAGAVQMEMQMEMEMEMTLY